MTMTLFVHIVAGGLGLITGYVALYAAKGAALHRKSGMMFVYAMLIMSACGIVIAAGRGVAPAINIPAALLTSYLVITSLTTVRPLASGGRLLHIVAMLVALGVGVTNLTFAVEAFANGGTRKGMPAFPFVMFGVVGLLGAVGDLRMLRSDGLRGAARLSRHLWRMSFALFIAALSFFIGQAKVIPEAIRIPPLLALPVLAVLVTMFYWLWRVRRRSAAAIHSQHQLRSHSMQTLSRTLLIIILFAPVTLFAQENPLSAHNRHLYGGVKSILLRSAEIMPEENYAFKPAETVRSFGQIVGHVADAQYMFCSAVLGEKNPSYKVEKTKTSKAELIAALRDAFAYCDKAYDAMTDASGVDTVKLMGGDTPKLGALSVNNVHTIEHYGNLVTYLRMKNIVPPTSDPEFMQKLSRK